MLMKTQEYRNDNGTEGRREEEAERKQEVAEESRRRSEREKRN
jgi:hypothetical protein